MTKIRMAKNIYKISETIIETAIYFTASKVEISTMIEAKKQEKDKEITEDQLKALEKDIQKATDDAVKKIDSMTAEKEKELLTV